MTGSDNMEDKLDEKITNLILGAGCLLWGLGVLFILTVIVVIIAAAVKFL